MGAITLSSRSIMKKTILYLAVSIFAGAVAQEAIASATTFRIYIGGLKAEAAAAASDSGSSSSGGAPADPNGPTNFTFGNCYGKGAIGPTSAGCATAYNLSPPGTSFSVTNGVQHWTIPVTGTYLLSVTGATGGSGQYGSGGYGAIVKVTAPLVAGQVVDIVVGQSGINAYDSGGGGGASIISISGSPVVVAGGGGGGAQNGAAGNGSSTKSTAAGLGGQYTEAGAGYFGNGPSAVGYGQAISVVNGATGSSGGTNPGAVAGGFGGGGGGGARNVGGGGGGYDGGSAGQANGYGGSGGTSYWASSTTLVKNAVSSVTTPGSVFIGLQ